MKRIDTKKSLIVFAPLLAMSAWIGSMFFHTQTADEVVLRIDGFDPRDLLSGHYLRYRVDYGRPSNCLAKKRVKDWCACLSGEAGEINTASRFGSCVQMSCSAVKLKGRCQGTRFIAGIERYYFPEVHKTKLKRVPPKSTIRVSVDAQGKGIVTGLEVEKTPLLDWIKQHNSEGR